MEINKSFLKDAIYNLRDLQRNAKGIRMTARTQPVLIKAERGEEDCFVMMDYDLFEKLVDAYNLLDENKTFKVNKKRSEEKIEFLKRQGQR